MICDCLHVQTEFPVSPVSKGQELSLVRDECAVVLPAAGGHDGQVPDPWDLRGDERLQLSGPEAKLAVARLAEGESPSGLCQAYRVRAAAANGDRLKHSFAQCHSFRGKNFKTVTRTREGRDLFPMHAKRAITKMPIPALPCLSF